MKAYDVISGSDIRNFINMLWVLNPLSEKKIGGVSKAT